MADDNQDGGAGAGAGDQNDKGAGDQGKAGAGDQQGSGDQGKGADGGDQQKGAGDKGAQGGDQQKAEGDQQKSGAGDQQKGADDQSKPGDWPADWKTKMAGEGNDKLAKALDRYGSPQAVAEALAAAQEKIRTGAHKKGLPDKATPEQLAEYRKENDIPESPDKYDTNVGEGLVIGDADKPMAESFLKHAHENNLPNVAVKTALSWFFKHQEKVQEDAMLADAGHKKETLDALKGEWGADIKRNTGISNEVLKSMPDGLGDDIWQARLPSGRLLGADPRFIRWTVAQALELNPEHTVVPTDGQTPAATIDTEINSIKALMGDYNSEYHKGPKAAQMQARYRQLLDLKEKYGKRAA